MVQYRKHSMASAIALAISLTACGGGGGGSGVASIPSPPPALTPTPTPTPTPNPGTVAAPAMAVVPNASLFPRAISGGPTMQQHAATQFPLLQSVVSVTGGRTATANTAVMNGGATLTFESSPPSNDHRYKLSVPALGFSDLALVAGGFYCYTLCGSPGSNTSVELSISDPATNNLSWTTFGNWGMFQNQDFTLGFFVTGYETPFAAVPTTGSASYNGTVAGMAFFPENNAVGSAGIEGNAALQANFGSGSITGNLTNMRAGGAPWNSVSLSGSIAGGQNSFSGTSAATSAPGGPFSLSGTASGTFAGRFFGPTAQELGAVWTLHDGKAGAVGTIVAKRP